MDYSIEIIRKAEQNTTTWAGGTTTQLAIFPPDALYSDRNFLWRISSAKVEAEESIFTSLPGIWRLIMVLEGELHLVHEGHHKVTLTPFEQDSFSGDWTTKSYGKVTDFNLMMADGCEGKLEAIILSKGAFWNASPADKKETVHLTETLYCVEGKIVIHVGDRVEMLEAGDFFLLQQGPGDSALKLSIKNLDEGESRIIYTNIIHRECIKGQQKQR